MPVPDPSRIVDALSAYWRTAALVAAIDLDLFTVLGRGSRTAAQLARACAADVAATRTLCDSLVAMGLLRVRRGRYASAPDAARFLDSGSPDALAGASRFFAGPAVTRAFAGLTGTIRRGRGAGGAASRAGVWARFARDTFALREQLAEDLAAHLRRLRLGRGRILDVGAGASPLGITLLRRARSASLVVQDRRPIVAEARRRAAAAGVGARVATLPGEAAMVDWGGPFDLLLMVNVLDYFSGPDRHRLLRKARAALRPGGLLVVAAPLLDKGRHSPPDAVAYNLLLLALQSPGRPSTVREMRQQLRRAGFASVTHCASPSMLLARR